MEAEKEKDLYEPVMKALEKDFSVLGDCFFEITATRISNNMKRYLDDMIVLILGTEGKKPDIMGIVKIKHKSGYEEKQLLVVEVKIGSLSFDDLYQLKKYAEMFSAQYAILVSPEGFDQARRIFIKNRQLLTYFGYRSIWPACLVDKEFLEYDKELCYGNPLIQAQQKIS